MKLAGQALEVILLVSALAHGLLLLAVLTHRNGRVWSIFQSDVFLGFVGALGAWLGLQGGVFVPHARSFTLTVVALGLLGLGRLGGAITKVMLALHLKKPNRDGVPPPVRPYTLHRDERWS